MSRFRKGRSARTWDNRREDRLGFLRTGGGELVSFHAKQPDLAQRFADRFPRAKLVRDEREILEDGGVRWC